jgi:sugar lactone lactonase YvrE
MAARPYSHTRSAGAQALLRLVGIVLAVAALGAAAAVAAAPASAATSEDYFFVSSIGPTYGSSGQYDFGASGAGPNGIATDSAGNIYVTLPIGFAKFSPAGTHIVTYTGDGAYTAGNSYGLDVDWRGNVFYADRTNHIIAKLHPNTGNVNGTSYTWVSLTGKLSGLGDANIGAGDGEFHFPADVAVGGNYLYVADMFNHRVQKFFINPDTNQLDFDSKWGKASGGSGTADGEFNKPRSVDAMSGVSGHIFVAEETGRRVQEFSTAGAFVSKFGSTSAADPLYFSSPTGVDVDANGDVYVTDCDTPTSWVGKFRSSNGVWSRVTRTGSYGVGNAQFTFPWNSVVDTSGYLWVTDTQNSKLKKFARDLTAPTVTPIGFKAGWTNDPRFAELEATDPTVAGQYASGDVSIFYSYTGGAPWSKYMEPLTTWHEGDNPVTCYATDAVGNASAQMTTHMYYDKTKPVTTAAGVSAGWSRTDVAVILQVAGDGLSPLAATQYRLQGAPAWITYAGPFAVSAEGQTVYEYRSLDSASNYETPKTLTVSIDKTAPVTTVSSVSSSWSTTPLPVTFSPQDATSGIASTEYSTDAGATWTAGLSASISAQGVSTMLVRSTDVAGNVEAAQTVTGRVDSVRPTPTGLANRTVKRNKTVKLPFRIGDVTGAQARVTIRIYRGSLLKKTLAVGTKAANTDLTCSYRCTLAKGKYSWKVYATDMAGNTQARPAVKTLTVK